MKLINCLPYDVNVILADGTVRTIPASGLDIRLAIDTVPVGEFEGIPLTRTEFCEPEGLPEYEEGTLLIVFPLMKSACPHRPDLLTLVRVVKDSRGNILGCRSLGL